MARIPKITPAQVILVAINIVKNAKLTDFHTVRLTNEGISDTIEDIEAARKTTLGLLYALQVGLDKR